jgi:16S rRNA (cytosine967-C5)-methyltransferase
VEVVAPDPRATLLSRAAGPGRVRGAALELLVALDRAPQRPGAALARLAEHRHLHSAERRLVGDGVRGVIRARSVLAWALGTDDPLAAWVGWLVGEGLPVGDAAAALAAEGIDVEAQALAALADPDAARRAACVGLDPIAAIMRAGALSEPLARALLTSLGDQAGAFLDASAVRAPLDLRVNVARATAAEVTASLAEDGITVAPLPLARDGLRVLGRGNVVGSRAFRAGLVEIQEEGSQLLVELVGAGEGLVVDRCAGAGGKALAIAARRPAARIVACDVRPGALRELGERARRAKASITRVTLDPSGRWPADPPPPRGRADVVLVDAPCTGTGTLRRHPEHRLRLDGEAIDAMPTIQAEILDDAATLVRPGGRLVYATCSVLHAENDGVVDAFLGRNPAFRVVPLADVLGPARAAEVGDGRALRLGPHTHNTEGFFGIVLERAEAGR